MKIKRILPDEIITTTDFPVHNLHILKIYFKICKNKSQDILPPTPIIPLKTGVPLLKGKNKREKEYNSKIESYLKQNKKIKYLMCDGSHKTTALTLTHKKIKVVLLETNEDIEEIKDLIKTGEFFSVSTKDTIKETLDAMAKHLSKAKFFETIKDKTERMVNKKAVPQFMIDYYRREKK